MSDESCPKCAADAEREAAIRERWDRVWAEGRAAGIKTLPYWRSVVDKIVGRRPDLGNAAYEMTFGVGAGTLREGNPTK